ncbi:CD109 antigen-like [Chironomus tepperi]|uniref:CD109 antigen-like n=1 Tax=Chironomus tepperi TaxID=113505 RepID=UPI00391FB93C
MRSKILIFSFILCVTFCNIVTVFSKEYFAVVSNRLIRPNKPYQVAVKYQNYKTDEILQIGLNSSKFSEYKNVTLAGDGDKTVEFLLTDNSSDDCNLEVKAIGESFETKRLIKIVKKQFSVFIQTDKSIYKPADKVQFRVLLLDADTRPFNASKVKIFITDGGDNRVKQFNVPKFVKGVYQNELQLSDLPVMGKWNIHVEVNDEKDEKKEFEVAEYVLPKFEFTIDANPNANHKDGKIRATVKAKYTFGKTAKGNATITATPVGLYYNKYTEVTKTVAVDGKKYVEFDIHDELKVKVDNLEYKVKLFATFTEELSGQQLNASTEVQVRQRPYEFALRKNGDRIKPGFPYKITAFIKPYDIKQTPITDLKNPVIFRITYYKGFYQSCYQHGFRIKRQTFYPHQNCYEEETSKQQKWGYLNNGVADVEFILPPGKTSARITASYLADTTKEVKVHMLSEEERPYLRMELLTERPLVNRPLRIKVEGTEELNSFTYLIIGSGNVIDSTTISVPDLKKTEFSFTPSDEMAPTSHIIIYYITSDGVVISDKLKIDLEKDFKNLIDIQLSASQLKPSSDLNITVKSKEDSFIGLLGVDQSVLVLKKGNDIDRSQVMQEIEKINKAAASSSNYYKSYRDFKDSDAYIITNAQTEGSLFIEKTLFSNHPIAGGFGNLPGFGHGFSSVASNSFATSLSFNSPSISSLSVFRPSNMPVDKPATQTKPIEIRKEFPETWLFDSFDLNSNETTKVLSIKAPDTITSWIITGFSVNPTYGLGLTKEASTLNVFQPFFVSTNLPYSIKRGEVVAIPFTVFNYMQNDQEVEVKFFNADREFEFVEVNEEENDVKQRRKKRGVELERKKNVFVKSNEGATVKFMIRSLKVGYITIKVTAESKIAGDGVEQKLLVVPEGVTQYMNEAVLVDLRNSSEFKTSIEIKVPNNTVEDSTRIEAAVSGDLLGPSIENLDKLIKLPYGCGEQNMVNFVPNIVVLDYLTSVNKLTPEIKDKAKKHMESGYQRELGYKHDDGSYSAFGKSDSSGSTWLTAFVIKSFNQASKYIEIETNVMNQGLQFLSDTQENDGSFSEVGNVIHSDLQGGSSNGIGLTAYVLTTFLEAHNADKYKDVIRKGLKYISENVEELNDNYSMAIASYALQLAKDSTYDSIRIKLLEKLNSKAENEGQLRYWKRESEKKSNKPNSVDIEMTSYALLAYLEAGLYADGFGIGKWLITQRNENGGFQSTQDTVVGLQALAKLASKASANKNDININIKTDEKSLDMNINSENALVLQKFELPSNSRHFEIIANGQGTCLLQIAHRYNIDNSEKKPRFTLEPTIGSASHKEYLHLIVCTKFVPDKFATKSNMAVMEVTLPSGFTFDTDYIEDLRVTKGVKKVETQDSDTIVILYFDDIDATEVCPEFKAYRTHGVAKQKPSPIIIYDYYDNSRHAREFYNSPEISLCDICGDEDECRSACETSEIKIV